MEMRSYFKGLLNRIEPPDKYVSSAKKAHETLRKRLEEDDDVGQAHLDTFLSGSYARRTAIKEIKDVDIICVLDIKWDITEPQVVLAWLQDALQRYYKRVQQQDRSVRVVTDDGVQLDLVPGAPISRADGPLRIPDRDVKTWVISHPKNQMAFAEKRNKETDGYFVQTVKIFKHWRDRLTSVDAKVKSYILETLVAESLYFPPASHAHGVVLVFESIWQRHSHHIGTGRVPAIPDPGYPSNSVSKRWKSREFDTFMTGVKQGSETAKRALAATDEATSISEWRRLFGNKFAPPD
jgi:hypothetical protein